MVDHVGKWVIVTTGGNNRGVFFGKLTEWSRTDKVAVLEDAKMIVHWPASTKGLLGLAANACPIGSKITPGIPWIEINEVNAIMVCSGEATDSLRVGRWDA